MDAKTGLRLVLRPTFAGLVVAGLAACSSPPKSELPDDSSTQLTQTASENTSSERNGDDTNDHKSASRSSEKISDKGPLSATSLGTPETELAQTKRLPVTRFKQADEAFKKRKDETQARLALREYRKFYRESPTDPEAAWRVAMACYFVGIRLTADEEEREKIYKEGRDVGLKAVSLDPKCAACQFWTAINMALYGETVGVFKMLFTLNTIEEHLWASIKADPKYAYGGAYRLLGTIEWKLPGILGGSDNEARDFFNKAIQTAPDEPLHYLFLAKLLYEEFDDTKEAVKVARAGISVPPPTDDRLEAQDAIQDLKKLLAEWEKAVEDGS